MEFAKGISPKKSFRQEEFEKERKHTEFNQSETIKNIDKYISELEKNTASKPHKPFFSIYAKKRHWLNIFKYILGEYKFKWFEKGKEPSDYKNAFELYTDLIDLDVKDIQLN